MIGTFTNSSVQMAIIGRLRRGPHTLESLSALLDIDLPLIRYAVNGLEAVGRVRRKGVLVELIALGRSAA